MTEYMTPPLTVEDEWLSLQSAGALSDAKQFLLDCQADMRPDVRGTFGASDHVAGALLEGAPSEALSDAFLGKLTSSLSGPHIEPDVEEAPSLDAYPDWMPKRLAAFMARRDMPLKWRAAGIGVQRASVARTETGERMYLLRAGPGFSIPSHSHRGEEWTLVLAGGYKVDGQGYGYGDVQREDATCTHTLRVDDDGPCISLIVDEGRLKFESPLLKIIQPLLGV